MAPPLRVCVDARLEPGAAGGVVHAVLGLARGLSELEHGDEEYRFLVRPGGGQWLEPFLGDRLGLLPAVRRPAQPARRGGRALRAATRLRERISRDAAARAGAVPESKGAIEAAGVDVMHMTFQAGFRTRVPSLYQPWDLQHVHFPEFFTEEDRAARDAIYRELCARARTVVAATDWGARDLVEHLGVPPRKIAVVPLAAAVDPPHAPDAAERARVERAYELPREFALYPAQTWPHKNHRRLIAALAELAGAGTRIPLVCTGWLNDHHATLENEVRRAGLGADVRFLGQLPVGDLEALYSLARVLAFPSLFEGWGFPVLEAFAAGLPVVCSDIGALRNQVGDAAVTFDPTRPEDIAGALQRVWTDEPLRRELVERGRAQLESYSWEQTARIFRAHYRRLGRRLPTDEDESLIRESAFERRVAHV